MLRPYKPGSVLLALAKWLFLAHKKDFWSIVSKHFFTICPKILDFCPKIIYIKE